MRYLSQPGGFYGTGLGNNMAFPMEEMRRRGITPGGGPQLPLAYGGGGMAPMGNAGALAAGFQNSTVY